MPSIADTSSKPLTQFDMEDDTITLVKFGMAATPLVVVKHNTKYYNLESFKDIPAEAWAQFSASYDFIPSADAGETDETMVTCGHKTTKPAAWIVDIVKSGSHWNEESGFVAATGSPKSAEEIAKAKKKKEAALSIAADAAFKKETRINAIIKTLSSGDETEDEIKAIKKKARGIYKAEVEKERAEKKSSGSTGKEAGKKRKTEDEQVAGYKKQLADMAAQNDALKVQVKLLEAEIEQLKEGQSESETESEESESDGEDNAECASPAPVSDTLPPNTMIHTADSQAY